MLKEKLRSESVIYSPLLCTFDFCDDMSFVNLTFKHAKEGQECTMGQFLNRVQQTQHHSKHLLISGDPSSCKTTLVRYLAKGWAEGNSL